MTIDKVFQSLVNNDYESFRQSLDERISEKIEEKVWNYYSTIEKEINDKMSTNKDSSQEE